MAKFKGKQGKLSVEEIKEDNYIHIVGENGRSVCSISTTDDQYNEALIYATLFSKAPEMLKMLNRVRLGEFPYDEIKQLIKEATELN